MAGVTGDVTSTATGFHTQQDGFLYCDDVKISDLHQQLRTSQESLPTSPVFVYSRRQLEKNVRQFRDALGTLPVPAKLNFAMKSNHNLQILKLLRSLGCGITLVSGNEMHMALEAGFEPENMLLNGSGKVLWEVEAAVKRGVLLNVDSEFDLQQTIEVCRRQGEGTTARALLRLNLDIDPKVHKYVSTGSAGSKFGLDPAALSRVVRVLTSDDCPVRAEGLHCHLGSTIEDTAVFRQSMKRLLALRQQLKAEGLEDLNLINVGGGLAIDYTRYKEETQPHRAERDEVKTELNRLVENLQVEASAEEDQQRKALFQCAADVVTAYDKERIPRSKMDSQLLDMLQRLGIADVIQKTYAAIWREKPVIPTAADLARCFADVFVTPRDDDVTLVFEPGRAIVGDAGVLMTTALGWKAAGNTKFLVVDGAMTEVIRPSLYGSYHHIHPAAPPLVPAPGSTQPLSGDNGPADSATDGYGHVQVVDVVGAVCESGDFLGKDRLFALPSPGASVVLHDAGAYCSSMASNYNLRPRPAEVMVDGSDWTFIRRPDTLKDMLAPYKTDSE